jgi:hypothetical protein
MAEGDAEQLVFSLLEWLLNSADGKRHHRIRVSGAASNGRLELQLVSDYHLDDGGKWDMLLNHLVKGEPVANPMDLELYVARDIVVHSEGTIHCEREAGVGCTFFVSLPMVDRVGTE